jgi:hypothetical protein
MAVRVDAGALDGALKDILKDFNQEVIEGLNTAGKKIAKEGVSRLRSTSPRQSGRYAKGWRVKTEKGNKADTNVIYNATDYRLTHLLENGHVIKNGTGRTYGKTAPVKHIEPVEQEAVEAFENALEEILK